MVEIDWATAKVEWRTEHGRSYKYVNGRRYGWYETDARGCSVWWYDLSHSWGASGMTDPTR